MDGIFGGIIISKKERPEIWRSEPLGIPLVMFDWFQDRAFYFFDKGARQGNCH